MSSALEQMYQQVILDHAKRPHGRVASLTGEGIAHQVNPMCGDEITMRVDLDASGVVRAVVWTGQGCSISQASASVMTELVVGESVEHALRLDRLFLELMSSRGRGLDSDDEEDALGDATVFVGVSRYPARIKCALLGWAALKDALARSGGKGVTNE